MVFERQLPTPEEIKEKYHLSADIIEKKRVRDIAIQNIFSGKDDRLALIIGPCSADRENSVMDYIHRLAKLQEEVSDKILFIPRVYTNKPRTTGDGYKGMVHQPDPNKKPDMLEGLLAIRRLHTRCIEETGFGCADEMLYPENYSYLSDVLSYVAIGARSVENQQHRLTASGIDVPVGMKNPTSGEISVMLNAITAATHPHTYIYRGCEVHTSGNPLAHAVLRGSSDKYGQAIPNYHYEDLQHLIESYSERNPEYMSIVVDANHYNSNKKYEQQTRICKEVIHSCRLSKDIHKALKGIMIESYIEDGCQAVDGGVYGKSITDPCLGWEKTKDLVLRLADLW